MHNKKPPFEITTSILDKIAQIAELVGQVSAVADLTTNPMLRRANRIRTIYSSLAIEQNTLSLEQVTAVLNGKRVIAPPKDIAEVKNAYEIYEMMDSLNPYSVDDLLTAHGVMTKELVEESGRFRSGPVGVVDRQGNILHFGTLPDYVPGLVTELLDWVRDSDYPMLIKSCVFHYELELIHPFADGNGRITIKGGYVFTGGGNQGGSSSTIGSASQGYDWLTGKSFSETNYYTLADASDNNIFIIKLPSNCNVNSSYSLISAPQMVKGSTYTLKSSTTAPTDATSEFEGFYLGSSAVGTTSVASFTAQ